MKSTKNVSEDKTSSGLREIIDIVNSAYQGNADSQTYLGDVYLRGLIGVEPNEEKASFWLHRAVSQNYFDKNRKEFYAFLGAKYLDGTCTNEKLKLEHAYNLWNKTEISSYLQDPRIEKLVESAWKLLKALPDNKPLKKDSKEILIFTSYKLEDQQVILAEFTKAYHTYSLRSKSTDYMDEQKRYELSLLKFGQACLALGNRYQDEMYNTRTTIKEKDVRVVAYECFHRAQSFGITGLETLLSRINPYQLHLSSNRFRTAGLGGATINSSDDESELGESDKSSIGLSQ